MFLSNLLFVLTFVITGFCIGGSRAGSTKCSDNSTCSSVEACIKGVCTNPCSLALSCGENAECFVVDHFAHCRCLPGFVRGPNGCVPPKQPETTQLPAGSTKCSDNSTCSALEACVKGVCVDPCTLAESCGKDAECFVTDHTARCRCKPGFVRNKNGCFPQNLPAGPKTCSGNKECGSKEGCINGVCADPCSNAKPCGPGGKCVVRHHKPTCKCKTGFILDENGVCKSASEKYTAPSKDEPKEWLKWIPGALGEPPANAIKAGYEKAGDLYICRAWISITVNLTVTDLVPGKLLPREACYISWQSTEHIYYNSYEILTGSNATWVPAKWGLVPISNLVIGGYTEHENLYVGRTKYKATVTPGKVQLQHMTIYLPIDGKEVPVREYEVLTTQYHTSPEKPFAG